VTVVSFSFTHIIQRYKIKAKQTPSTNYVWNKLLTKKLPMFLSRLNEMRGGCEKIVPVSGSFWSNLKFLPPQSFGPVAKTRGGIIVVRA